MADVPPDPNSGAAGTEYQTAAALRRLGHEVETVWADAMPHRIRHGNLHYLLELPYAYRSAMLTGLRRQPFDVIHVNQPHGYLAARALRARGLRTVFIHRSHGLELRAERELAHWCKAYGTLATRSWGRAQASQVMSWLLRRHSRAISQCANGHIVSASACARFLVDELHVPVERIAVIPQAAPKLYLDRPVPVVDRARFKRLLYVGQFAFLKAPMVMASVINAITQADEFVSATWVTQKAAHAHVYKMLSETARGRVTLLDWMPQNELIEVYDKHGIFMFPSFFEGFGKAFLEAMARGLCVIAADNGGAADVISHGQDGMLVCTGDVNDMIHACLKLLRSPDLAQTMSQHASARARQYSWDRVARETAAFYMSRLVAQAS